MFGLKGDRERCFAAVAGLCRQAAATDRFLRLDMEDSSCTDDEIELYTRLRRGFPGHVAIVFQAYLKRTAQDLRRLDALNTPEHPVDVRLCKGIYIEPQEIAFRRKEEIHAAFLADLDFMLERGFRAAIATHHDELIQGSLERLAKHGTSREMYEFQFLHGVRPRLVEGILAQGHPVRIYIPYGAEWLSYSTRRLQENPNIVGHVVKSTLFGRG